MSAAGSTLMPARRHAARLAARARRLVAIGRSAATPTPAPPSATELATNFLAREARLLDERRWDDWLELWAADLSYAMPTRSSVRPTGPDRSVDLELTPASGVWWFDEGREFLETRIAKLKTGKAWAEEPPSRTRRLVTNVEATEDDRGLVVRSNLLIHRNRRDDEIEWFSCGRVDHLERDDSGALRLTSRRVVLDTNVVPADNLILFF